MSNDIVTLKGCEIKQVTPQSILVNYKGIHKWLPKSRVENVPEEIKIGERFDLRMPEWLAVTLKFTMRKIPS